MVGALTGDALGDATRLGLDALVPAYFLALLLEKVGDRRSRVVAAIGAGLALVLVPLTPVGVPVLAASAAHRQPAVILPAR